MIMEIFRYIKMIIAKELMDKTTRLSWLLVLVSSAVVLYILSVIEIGTSKEAIFPKAQDRFDIATLYGARLDDVCPDAAQNPNRTSFEACLRQIDPSKLMTFTIPTFDEIGEIPPDMPAYLANSKDPQQQRASQIFAPNSAFIIAVPIPEEHIAIDGDYWDKDQSGGQQLAMDRVVRARPLLSFRGMRFGTVCIEGRCHQELLESTTGANTIPLVWREAPAPEERFVWIFGMENNRAVALQIHEGLMISEAKSLMSTVQLYSLYFMGRPLRMAQNFMALFIIALVFGILHRSFLDYPAMATFSASMVLWASTAFAGLLLPWYRGPTHHAGYFLSWGLVLTSSLMLAFGIRRQRTRIFQVLVLGSGLSAMGAFSVYYLAQRMDVSVYWGLASALFVVAIAFGNLYLLADQLPILADLKAQLGQHGRLSLKKDYSNRQREIWMHLVIWSVLSVSMMKYAWGSANSTMVQRFSSSILFGLFPILGVMLYFMYSKQRTHVRSNPHAEVLRLQQRLTPEEFAKLMEQTRQSVVWTLDIEGSTGRDRKTKRLMMQRLLNQAARDLEEAHSYLDLPTGGGDEWRLITGMSHTSLAEDLRAKVELLQCHYQSYLGIVQEALPGCGLHAVVMVLSQYTMACGEPEDATSLPTIDFSSEEADALMEHLGKPKIPGSILVCGPRAILSPGLETIPCLQALDSLDRILDEKTAALQLIQDQGNNLEVTKKLKKLSKALETSRHYDLVYTHVQPTTASIAGDAHTAA